MPATERVVIMLTLQQKRQLTASANQSGLSVSEYVRTRVLEDPEIDEMVDQINAVADRATEALDRLARQVANLETAERTAHTKACKELCDLDPARFARLIQQTKAVA